MTAPRRAASVVHGIGTLVTARGSGPLRGRDLGDLDEVQGAAVAIDDMGCIIACGVEAQVRVEVTIDGATVTHDAGGALAIPGLVDCHAHPVFAGDRSDEFRLRSRGADYEEIHAAGGGIRRTVEHTRAALDDGSADGLVRRHLDWMLAAGTTTAEGKSGYGLTLAHELESLRSLQRVGADHAVRVTGTVLAAHTAPAEYDGREGAYLDDVAVPAVRAAAEAGLATGADIFVERGSFSADQAVRYLTAAHGCGLAARLHGDQFSDHGAVDAALRVGARSIDHLEALAPGDRRLQQLATSDIASVVLPLSSLMLGRPWAPGRALADAGGIVALASDFNPGSSYGESLTLAMSLACIGCGLTPAEALAACTANAAWVLRLHARVGRLAPGMCGDLVLLDQPSLAHLPYHVGSPAITAVFVGGRRVGP